MHSGSLLVNAMLIMGASNTIIVFLILLGSLFNIKNIKVVWHFYFIISAICISLSAGVILNFTGRRNFWVSDVEVKFAVLSLIICLLYMAFFVFIARVHLKK